MKNNTPVILHGCGWEFFFYILYTQTSALNFGRGFKTWGIVNI